MSLKCLKKFTRCHVKAKFKGYGTAPKATDAQNPNFELFTLKLNIIGAKMVNEHGSEGYVGGINPPFPI